MLKRLLTVSALIALGMTKPAIALERQTLSDAAAQNEVQKILVARSHSTTLTMNNGQRIQSILIDNPNTLGVATDRPLCGSSGTNSGGGCGNASLVRLTSLNGEIGLPGVGYTANGGTVSIVTVVTTGRQGEVVYQFEVTTNVPSAPVSLISIEPVPPQVDERASLAMLSADIDIEKVLAGRDHAIETDQADTESPAWAALENFLALVKGGQSVTGAARVSGVPIRLLNALENMAADTTATEDPSVEI